MATSASLTVLQAINKTFPAGSNERKALTAFVTGGLNVNQNREQCLWVAKAWAKVLPTIKQTWGLG